MSLDCDVGDGNEGDGNDGEGNEGDGNDGVGDDGDGNDGKGDDGDGNDGIGDDDGEGREGEGIEDGEGNDGLGGVDCGERLLGLLGLLGNGFGTPCGCEDGSGTLQPANTNASVTATTPIADCLINNFNDARKSLIAITQKPGSASARYRPDSSLRRSAHWRCPRKGSRQSGST